MTHRPVDYAARALEPAPRLALAALLCTSLASAEAAPKAVAAPAPSMASASMASASMASASSASASDAGWLAWTAIGVGGGLLALSAWQWVVFANENSDAGDVCPARSGGLARCADATARADYLAARDDAKSARVLAAIFSGLGAASLVTGLLLLPEADAGSGQPIVAFSADPLSGDARASLSWAW